MFIPDTIVFLNYSLKLIYLIVFFAIVLSSFIYWYEVKKDGFDEEFAFDTFIISIVVAYIVSRLIYAVSNQYNTVASLFHVIYFWEAGYNIYALIVAAVCVQYLLVKRKNWSVYRILDIFSISMSFFLSIFFLGNALIFSNVSYLFVSFCYFILFISLKYVRQLFLSGYTFSIFLVFSVLIGLVIHRSTVYLIFYAILITMSVVNIFFRYKRNNMSSNISREFINKVKKMLTKKEKELESEQKLLISEDPYMVPGRDNENEYVDDVNEDIEKNLTDIRLSRIKDLKIHVRKALAKIKLGKYGYCEVCGEPIDEKRLSAFPEATTCVAHSK